MPEFSHISKERLSTCDSRLQVLFNRVITKADCTIVCGHRNQEDQDKAFHDGFSLVKWPNGKHNAEPSRAVDVMPYPVDWTDAGIPKLEAFAVVVKETIAELGLVDVISWGGDWEKFIDRPHWEISA